MTEIYEVSAPSDRAEEVIKWLASKGLGEAPVKALFDAAARQNFAAVISGALEDSAGILRSGADDDVEGAFTLILSLLSGVSAEDRKALVKKLAEVITSPAEGKGALVRLRVLSSLYNNLKESTEKQSKLEVLRRLIAYATETRSMEALRGYLQQVSGWTFLTQEEAATLYLLISTSYQKLGMTDEEQHFLVKYLSTFEGVPPEAMAAATHAARSAAINYIRAPAGSQKYHVPRLQAVKSLATHPQHARLYELVDIFAHRDLSAFTAWSSKSAENAAYLTEQGIDVPKSIETMRLLTLCSLAAKEKTLSYDAISAGLQCPAAEVESWVVRAITAGLVDARIDQEGRAVVVTRTTQRVFDAAAWKGLQTTLHQWRGTVNQLLRSTEDALGSR